VTRNCSAIGIIRNDESSSRGKTRVLSGRLRKYAKQAANARSGYARENCIGDANLLEPSIHRNSNATGLTRGPYRPLLRAHARAKQHRPRGLLHICGASFGTSRVITSPLFARRFPRPSQSPMRVTFPFPLRATRINSRRATSARGLRGIAFIFIGRIAASTINRRLIEYVDPVASRHRHT